ncbi:hypothetical protein HD554DRAFT_2165994 [Boletus coccyginus]|nr:hypothetical protein HD554DRAFT_2165994 [Boletus coccyginus]
MSSPPALVLDDTFGALFVGVIVAATLYGVTCVQTWFYYTHYPSDPWYIKLLVFSILVSDTGHQALITHTIYTYLVTDFGVYEALGKIVWSLIVGDFPFPIVIFTRYIIQIEIFFNAFTTLVVQCFLTMRIYMLSNKNWIATGSAIIFIIAQLFVIFAYAAKAVHFETFQQLSTLKALSVSVNATSSAGDLLIALILCYLLQKSRTGFRKSDMTINKLIVFSINTGLLTSICALASLFCTVVWPTKFIYIAFYFNLGRLYCNSLLATLNARKRLRSESHIEDISLAQGGTQRMTKLGTASKASFLRDGRAPNNISIQIDTTHEYMQDEESSRGDVKESNV